MICESQDITVSTFTNTATRISIYIYSYVWDVGRGPEGSNMYPTPTLTSLQPYGFLNPHSVQNKKLDVNIKIKGLTSDSQLFSEGTLKTRIPIYRGPKIYFCIYALATVFLYVPNDLYLLSNEIRVLLYQSHQCQVEAKWPSVDKLRPF